MTSQRTFRLVMGAIAAIVIVCIGGFLILSFLPSTLLRLQGKVAICQNDACSYVNGDYSFTVATPPGWEPRAGSGNPFQIVTVLKAGTGNVISIEHYPKTSSNQTLKDFTDRFVADGQQTRDGTNRRSFTSNMTTFQGVEAATVEYIWTGDGIEYRTRILLFPRVNEFYSFWLTADQRDFTQVVPLFETMNGSFRSTSPMN